MSGLAMAAVGLVAAIHLAILYVEMFAWLTLGPKVFRSLPRALFGPTRVLAANQGLYNGFLAAGLIWSLVIGDPVWAVHAATFALACVAVAGVYGAWTTGAVRILQVQTGPAVVALALVWLG
jgi:putative membrane protein